MKKIFVTISVILLTLTAVKAQVKIISTIGAGFAYASKKNIDASYSPFISPHFSTELSIPVLRDLSFETGLEYTQKGYNSFSKMVDERMMIKYFGKRRYQYLSIPIVANYCIYNKNKGKFFIGGGMNYGFFLKGKAAYSNYIYRDGVLDHKEKLDFPITGVWAKSDYIANNSTVNSVYKLDVMLRLQCRYIYKNRYILGAYYDHSMYDNNLNALSGPSSSLKLRYVGFSIGVIW